MKLIRFLQKKFKLISTTFYKQISAKFSKLISAKFPTRISAKMLPKNKDHALRGRFCQQLWHEALPQLRHPGQWPKQLKLIKESLFTTFLYYSKYIFLAPTNMNPLYQDPLGFNKNIPGA